MEDEFEKAARERRALLVLDATREALRTPATRLMMWEMIGRARVFASIWAPNVEIHYRAGRQDYGRELMALCIEADEALYELMEKEGRAQAKTEARVTEAARGAAAKRQQQQENRDG